MEDYGVILEKDEQVISVSRLHWIYFKGCLLTFLLSSFVMFLLYYAPVFSDLIIFGIKLKDVLQTLLFVFVLISCADSYLNYQASFYMITNKRVIICSGWIIKSMRDIMLHRIEGVRVVQSLTGRVLNFGSVVLFGMGTCVDSLILLPSPFVFRAKIQEYVNKKSSVTTS
ncbi:MAG: PH domain-containing protein [Legionellales bacterium]|jgi:hypothetical protein|nr:PH domain-containing protein [Legionellales bacterium]